MLWVALGGSIGSVVRYALSRLIHSQYDGHFPVGTFVVNCVGCLLIGVVAGYIERSGLFLEPMRLFLIVGIMGGFTTFSSFSYESIMLLRNGFYLSVVAYVTLSVIVGTLLTAGGFFLVKNI